MIALDNVVSIVVFKIDHTNKLVTYNAIEIYRSARPHPIPPIASATLRPAWLLEALWPLAEGPRSRGFDFRPRQNSRQGGDRRCGVGRFAPHPPRGLLH